MTEKSCKDDTEMDAWFELLHKYTEHPEELTEAEKDQLRKYGINV